MTGESTPSEDEAVSFEKVLELERERLGLAVTDNRHAVGTGLALSGGGIRSATFSLGVLQALARAEKLASFDYLSTVSGGGYIGAWLSAWIKQDGLDVVQAQLGQRGSGADTAPRSCEPKEVAWLRRFSNYLTPRVGLFSTDTLTLISIWSRNVMLSLIILLAFFATLFLLPRLALLSLYPVLSSGGEAFGWVAVAFGALLFPAAINMNLQRLHERNRPQNRKAKSAEAGKGPEAIKAPEAGEAPGLLKYGIDLSSIKSYCMNRLGTPAGVMATVVLPGTVAAITGSFWLFANDADKSLPASCGLIYATVFFLVLVALMWLRSEWKPREDLSANQETKPLKHSVLKEGAVYLLATVVAIGSSMALLGWLHDRFPYTGTIGDAAGLLTLGPAVFLTVFGISGAVFVGLVGRVFFERSREWWSRMSACFMMVGSGWLLLNLCAFHVPALVDWAAASAGLWLKGVVGTGWLASLLGVLLARRKAVAPDQAGGGRLLFLANLAAAVFMVGFIMAAAALTDHALTSAADIARQPLRQAVSASMDLNISGSGARQEQHISISGAGPRLAAVALARSNELAMLMRKTVHCLPFLWCAFGATVLVLVVFGMRVDVNKFSLHNMYKNRLTRCYLGASNPARHPQPFTGFDDQDDRWLSTFARGNDVQRPYHIINTTLNLSQGKNLAWQERKGASFSLTPMYCGYELAPTQGDTTALSNKAVPAFRSTSKYADRDGEECGFSLGMAMATSGAAADPNMGAMTSPALAFLMTVFNVRLARWSPNPARTRWRDPSPGFGLGCLLQELFGLSNDESDFVNLSDGGHFENLGIYELVRRRCKLIVVVDGGADELRGFDDLGRAIRQCRIDFGVDIKINLSSLRSAADAKSLPQRGYGSGTIDYGNDVAGTLIFIKPTLCMQREEPVDVLNYGAKNTSFPQQSTGDQFFDESQFESYRQLGEHIAAACLKVHGERLVSRTPDSKAKAAAPSAERTETIGWLGMARKWMPIAALAGFALLTVLKAACLDAAAQQYCACPSLSGPYPSCPSGLLSLHVFLLVDTLWVPIYSAAFVLGYQLLLSGGAGGSRPRLWWALALSLVSLGAGVDFYENWSQWALLDSFPPTAGMPSVQPWTALKFVLFGSNCTLLLYLWLARRWKSAKEVEAAKEAVP